MKMIILLIKLPDLPPVLLNLASNFLQLKFSFFADTSWLSFNTLYTKEQRNIMISGF